MSAVLAAFAALAAIPLGVSVLRARGLARAAALVLTAAALAVAFAALGRAELAAALPAFALVFGVVLSAAGADAEPPPQGSTLRRAAAGAAVLLAAAAGAAVFAGSAHRGAGAPVAALEWEAPALAGLLVLALLTPLALRFTPPRSPRAGRL